MDYRQIYESRADDYDALVSAEDVDGNLLPALTEIMALDGKHLIEVGAGTGRITKLLIEAGASVIATEPAAAMISVARLSIGRQSAVQLCRAEASTLPLADQSVDAAIAGWVLGHQVEWSPGTWRQSIGAAIEEMDRTIRSGSEAGPVVIIETLGTNHATPVHPGGLGEYYDWLENELGFTSTWIRTDYSFENVETAARVLGNFFGADMAQQIRTAGLTRIPECTGIWWR